MYDDTVSEGKCSHICTVIFKATLRSLAILCDQTNLNATHFLAD